MYVFRPYGDTCSFCYLNYDLIGHTETFAEDTMHIVEKAGVRESIGQLRDLDMFEDPEPINRFTELTQEEMKKLYEIYKLDFEAFGYNFSAYLKQAVDANSNSGNSHANNNGRNKWKKSR